MKAETKNRNKASTLRQVSANIAFYDVEKVFLTEKFDLPYGSKQGERNMKHGYFKTYARVLAALALAVFMLGLSFAATSSPAIVYVGTAGELTAALEDAGISGESTVIYFNADTAVIELGGSAAVPSNVTIDLSANSGTLRIASGGALDVAGVIAGGALEAAGGTLVRESGSSITAAITVSGGGAVRGARVLSLENLDPADGEVIVSITYAGETAADTSGYIARSATGVIYPKMTGTNYSSFKIIETVVTDAGNVFRLGTANVDQLSLSYLLVYGGLEGATLDTLNPSSYTASDAAILLNNPEKEGFLFLGWTCEALGVTVPADELVIPQGTNGSLTLIANWAEDPAAGGRSGGSGSISGSGTTTSDDAATLQEAAAVTDTAATQQSTSASRRTRVASSSTKVTFTSETEAVMPTLESVRGQSFPWWLVVGGFAGLGIVIYIAVKMTERKKQM